MAERVPLSRAARLVGVSRAVLQRRIREGSLPSFEGAVRLEDLLRAFPGTATSDESEIARTEALKERAFGRRLLERALPDKEVLAARIGELAHDLAEVRARAARLAALLERVRERLSGHPLGQWLARELEAPMSEDERDLIASEALLKVVSPHVKLLPGGEEFFVEGGDSVLEAALRAGLALNYGCSIGNCGECKARIVAGRVRRLRPHDYRLSEAEKAAGWVLLCCVTPLTDIVAEAAVAHGAGDIPIQRLTAHVRRREPLGEAMALIELQTPRTQRLRFLAGQGARISLGGTSALWPIASCPCEERRLHLHVPRLPGNVFSDYVYERLRLGEAVEVEGPYGDFVLREGPPRPLVFVALSWQGFAPVKSVIEHAIAQEAADRIDLWWIGASERDLYHPKLCRSWADALDGFRYLCDIAGAGLHSQVRSALAAAVARLWPTLAEPLAREFYVAGDEAAVAACCEVLAERGIAQERIVAWKGS